MNPSEIAAVAMWVTLFLVGVTVYMAGHFLRRPHLKKVGGYAIAVWCLLDLILIIVASVSDWPQ